MTNINHNILAPTLHLPPIHSLLSPLLPQEEVKVADSTTSSACSTRSAEACSPWRERAGTTSSARERSRISSTTCCSSKPVTLVRNPRPRTRSPSYPAVPSTKSSSVRSLPLPTLELTFTDSTLYNADSPDNHDCVICQDPFALSETLLTLPCKHHHAFHEACIVPWLQNSGTCPTCRFALVPQPDPVTGVLPGQEGHVEAGGNTNAEAAISPEARAGEAAARRAAAAAGDRTGEGEQGGSMMSGVEAEEGEASLPGSWPTTEAERSRASSRARGRERAEREAAQGEGELPYDDLD